MMSVQSADPEYLTVHQLSAALRSRRLSSSELVNALLDRITTHDQKLHAFVALYPDEARLAAKAAAAAVLKPMPVVVLTASGKFIDVVPKLIQAGELPLDTTARLRSGRRPSAFSGAEPARGARARRSAHHPHALDIMIDNAPIVIQAIRMVVDAVRAGQTSPRG